MEHLAAKEEDDTVTGDENITLTFLKWTQASRLVMFLHVFRMHSNNMSLLLSQLDKERQFNAVSKKYISLYLQRSVGLRMANPLFVSVYSMNMIVTKGYDLTNCHPL